MNKFLKKKVFLIIVSLISVGFLLSTTLLLKIESTYDTELFNAIASNLLNNPINRNNQDSFFISSMSMANSLVQNRLDIFGGFNIGGIKANYIHAATVDLMTGNGACGSASVVLARILKANNYKTRVAQMKTINTWGGHIVLEVKKENGWVVLDPLLNIYFKRPDGNFASFADVSKDWSYYKKQVPSNYPYEYNYLDVRYTNWERLGPLAFPIKTFITAVWGKEYLATFCLRSYLLRVYHVWYLISAMLLVFNMVILILLFLKISKLH